MPNNELKILIVIARDRDDNIIFRVANAGFEDSLLEALGTARSVLQEQPEAVRTEVHTFESTESHYDGKPIATLTRDDIATEML